MKTVLSTIVKQADLDRDRLCTVHTVSVCAPQIYNTATSFLIDRAMGDSFS